ncbi:telomerase-binding protein EST1A isoform X6 [Anas platyrhynchos]|uniref:telomerase-binding protein EST1A isoform X6 n=1 Tax=Anas platyrhynchos TaxID=8839 RepID=UPI003AF2D18B
MAEGLERVRVSAAELRDMVAAQARAAAAGRAENMKEVKEPRHRKDNRRPDLEIYKPGLSRLRGKLVSPKHEAAGKERSGAEESREESAAETGPAAGGAPPVAENFGKSSSPKQNGPLQGNEETEAKSGRQSQESSCKQLAADEWCPKTTRRAKKPDQQIYQPGKRLHSVAKDPAPRSAAEEVACKMEQLRVEGDEEAEKGIGKDARKTKAGKEDREGSQAGEGGKASRGEKGRRTERGDRLRRANEEVALGKPGSTKRYSRSDKRRSRYRACSTSSAGSNNSVDGAPLLDGVERRQERARERARPRKQLSASSTDSLDEDRIDEAGAYVPGRLGDKKKRLEQSRASRSESEWSSNGREAKGSFRVTFDSRTMSRDVSLAEADKKKPLKAFCNDSEASEARSQSREPQGRGRGILFLPANTDLSASTSGSPEPGHPGPRLLLAGPKSSRSRGRGGTARRLWDPNNPEQKPALKSQSSQLHFLDTDDEVSPPASAWGDARQAQSSYYKFQNSDNPYYYPRAAGQGAQYPYAGYSLQYPVGPSNGVYPGAYYPGYPGQGGQYACGPLPPAPLSAEVEQQMRSMQQQELSKLLREAGNQEQQLSNLLSRDRISPEGLEKMAQLRVEMLQLYERCILMDIEFSDAQNVDQLLWKNAFYQVIEKFRQLLKDPLGENAQDIRIKLLQLLDEGALFFDGLLQKLQVSYQFKLEDYMDGLAIRSKPLRKMVKYALISAQRCMICQGDICRYREQANDTANYGKARSWYLKAQQIAPKNGRPYNQLALLAIYTRRKLDAVYYYMRSLAASNPILTAKESLMSLFEETKRKAEQMEQKKHQVLELSPSRRGKGKKPTLRQVGDDATRLEIWIHPSHPRSSQGHESGRDSEQDNGLGNLSPSDLNKRFILSFLHAHGKLFTRIGMETFPAVAEEVLREFQVLLQHSPPPIGSTRMLQLVAINMFAVYNSQPKGSATGIGIPSAGSTCTATARFSDTATGAGAAAGAGAVAGTGAVAATGAGAGAGAVAGAGTGAAVGAGAGAAAGAGAGAGAVAGAGTGAAVGAGAGAATGAGAGAGAVAGTGTGVAAGAETGATAGTGTGAAAGAGAGAAAGTGAGAAAGAGAGAAAGAGTGAAAGAGTGAAAGAGTGAAAGAGTGAAAGAGTGAAAGAGTGAAAGAGAGAAAGTGSGAAAGAGTGAAAGAGTGAAAGAGAGAAAGAGAGAAAGTGSGAAAGTGSGAAAESTVGVTVAVGSVTGLGVAAGSVTKLIAVSMAAR